MHYECLLRFPGVPLSWWPLRACCYRRGSADAARSRATDPTATSAEPTAILGLRRLVDLGATRIDTGQGEVSWVAMADPDGREFCVLTPR
jgi:Glyoxalase-like domain